MQCERLSLITFGTKYWRYVSLIAVGRFWVGRTFSGKTSMPISNKETVWLYFSESNPSLTPYFLEYPIWGMDAAFAV